MKNYVNEGDVIPVTAPSGGLTAGTGVLIGTALFGVAVNDADAGDIGQIAVEGVFDLAKTSALAISVGDLLYWDATNSLVFKTSSGNKCVGVAISAAANPSGTVRALIQPNTLTGA